MGSCLLLSEKKAPRLVALHALSSFSAEILPHFSVQMVYRKQQNPKLEKLLAQVICILIHS